MAGPWHAALSMCCFITGQAAGTGIPSRCRQDVGGNTWKSWHRPEGAGPHHRSRRKRPVPSSSPAGDFRCGATAESYTSAVGAASLRGKGLLPQMSVASQRQPALLGTYLYSYEHFPGASTPGSFPCCCCFPLLPAALPSPPRCQGSWWGSGGLLCAAALAPSPAVCTPMPVSSNNSPPALRTYPQSQPCSHLLFQELPLAPPAPVPSALPGPHAKPRRGAHDCAPGFPFLFFLYKSSSNMLQDPTCQRPFPAAHSPDVKPQQQGNEDACGEKGTVRGRRWWGRLREAGQDPQRHPVPCSG